jgi:hypothetical protein
LQVGGLFHDIGKIGVPDSILLKERKIKWWWVFRNKKSPYYWCSYFINCIYFPRYYTYCKASSWKVWW